MKRLFRSAFAWLLLAALLCAAVWLERATVRQEEIRAASGEPVFIIDGDSLRLGGREIRIAAIDAPEYRQSCTDEAGRSWPCGKEARAALETLARADGLTCTKVAEDRYGRVLGHCRTAQGDIAAALARQGWALGARDRRFAEPAAQVAEAKRARRGIWRGTHQHPADWRNAQRGT